MVVAPDPGEAYVVTDYPTARIVLNLNLPTELFEGGAGAPGVSSYGVVSLSSIAEAALARWNEVGIGNPPDRNFYRVASPVVAGDPCARDGVSMVQFLDRYCYKEWGSVAAVSMWSGHGGPFREVDILINPAYQWGAFRGPPGWSQGRRLFDFYRVMLHELGHGIGLGHPWEHGQRVRAIMSLSYSPGPEPDDLQADDIAGARAVNWSDPGGPADGRRPGGFALDAFLSRFYRNVLGREPDPGGLANWRAFLGVHPTASGAAAFAHGFLESPEFLGRNHPTSTYVTILYRTFMGREPDPAGYANWVSHLEAGRYTRRRVADLFIASAEFQALFRTLFP